MKLYFFSIKFIFAAICGLILTVLFIIGWQIQGAILSKFSDPGLSIVFILLQALILFATFIFLKNSHISIEVTTNSIVSRRFFESVSKTYSIQDLEKITMQKAFTTHAESKVIKGSGVLKKSIQILAELSRYLLPGSYFSYVDDNSTFTRIDFIYKDKSLSETLYIPHKKNKLSLLEGKLREIGIVVEKDALL